MPGDRFQLCSDGLTKTLDEAELTALLGAPEEVPPPGLLAQTALAHEASDNVTAMTVEVREGRSINAPNVVSLGWRDHALLTPNIRRAQIDRTRPLALYCEKRDIFLRDRRRYAHAQDGKSGASGSSPGISADVIRHASHHIAYYF
jgi:hypothetical protein